MNFFPIHIYDSSSCDIEVVKALSQACKLLMNEPSLIVFDYCSRFVCLRHRQLSQHSYKKTNHSITTVLQNKSSTYYRTGPNQWTSIFATTESLLSAMQTFVTEGPFSLSERLVYDDCVLSHALWTCIVPPHNQMQWRGSTPCNLYQCHSPKD